MTFWLVALLITLVIAAIGFYPLLKQKNRISQTERDQLTRHSILIVLMKLKKKLTKVSLKMLNRQNLSFNKAC